MYPPCVCAPDVSSPFAGRGLHELRGQVVVCTPLFCLSPGAPYRPPTTGTRKGDDEDTSMLLCTQRVMATNKFFAQQQQQQEDFTQSSSGGSPMTSAPPMAESGGRRSSCSPPPTPGTGKVKKKVVGSCPAYYLAVHAFGSSMLGWQPRIVVCVCSTVLSRFVDSGLLVSCNSSP